MLGWSTGAALLVLAATAGQAAAAPACPRAGFTLVEPSASAATRPVKAGPRVLFVRKDALTVTGDLTEIKLGGDRYDTALLMKFTLEAARRLHDATANHDGLRIAFTVGDRVVSAITWSGPYGMDADQGVQISLGRPTPQVRPMVKAIQRCIAKRG